MRKISEAARMHHREHDRERYWANREERIEYQKKYYYANREALRAKRRERGLLKYGSAR